MRILVCGPEFSGTDLTASLLELAGADVVHRPFPTEGKWPVMMMERADAAVVMSRDSYAMLTDQLDEDSVDQYENALYNIAQAQQRIWTQIDSMQIKAYSLTYEGVMTHPEVVNHLLLWLGLDPLDEMKLHEIVSMVE